MEPQSGIIFCQKPAGRPPDHLNVLPEGKAPDISNITGFVLVRPHPSGYIVKTPTQPTLHTTIHPPPTQTQCRQYLSCYWPDFYQTLKVGS